MLVQTTQKQIQREQVLHWKSCEYLLNFPNQELSPILQDRTSHSCSRKYSLSFGDYGFKTNVCWVLLWIYRVTESCWNNFFQDVLRNLQLPHFSLLLWKGCHYFQWPSHKGREEGQKNTTDLQTCVCIYRVRQDTANIVVGGKGGMR